MISVTCMKTSPLTSTGMLQILFFEYSAACSKMGLQALNSITHNTGANKPLFVNDERQVIRSWTADLLYRDSK
jgi:hypothetical protein